jgi:hypothetical protein
VTERQNELQAMRYVPSIPFTGYGRPCSDLSWDPTSEETRRSRTMVSMCSMAPGRRA